MTTTDPRIDAYIETSADFARPILQHLRKRVHAACPDAEETLKWSAPAFLYKGKLLCQMASFKQHVAFGFWQGAQVVGDAQGEAMGQFGRITKVADLPPARQFDGYVRRAMALVDNGVKAPRTRDAKPKPTLEIPDDLARALDAAPAARRHFDGFTPGKRREYIEWIVEAKQAATRERRLAQAVEWIAEGKPRHWKYQNC